MPTSTVGPKRGSQRAPTISSTPSRRSAISSTEKAGGSSRSTSSGVGGDQLVGRSAQADDDAARVGLVQQAQRLQHVRRPQRLRGGRQLLGASGPRAPRRRARPRPANAARAARCSRWRRPARRPAAPARRTPIAARQRHRGQGGRGVLDGREHRHAAVARGSGRRARPGRSTAPQRACGPRRRPRSAWRPRTPPGRARSARPRRWSSRRSSRSSGSRRRRPPPGARRRRVRSCAGPSRRRPRGRPGCRRSTATTARRRSARWVVSPSAGTSRPAASATSHAITPCPPPSVSTATRGPARHGVLAQREQHVGELARGVDLDRARHVARGAR